MNTLISPLCKIVFGAGLCLACIGSSKAEPVYDVFNPCPDVNRTADGKWELHDMKRPVPPKVAPKSEKDMQDWIKAPAGAIQLLGSGSDVSLWKDQRKWIMEKGVLEVVPKGQNFETVDSFGSCRLHVEWMAPAESNRKEQNRANSGIFLMSTYEVQVLDTYDNPTYADGMAGALYAVKPPDANPLRPSGQWQYYDIWFKRPTFDEKGAMVTPACVTVYINGVLVQDNVPFDGVSVYKPRQPYKKHADKLPLALQYHNEVISFRNIWLQPLGDDNVVSPAGKVGIARK
ncbi:MAG: DUF1080 domain-containing protein [Verrucomicrobiales bacterium]|jgi:hypothetical protein|nr:DUF1080 domain-containing protein [Verrucomicrobiales bacterium]